MKYHPLFRVYHKKNHAEVVSQKLIHKIKHQNGLTLIELMVALVLGLVLIGGVLNIFMRSRDTFRVNESVSRMQETARYTFETMSRDVREAGENACGTKLTANVVRAAGAIPWWADWESGTLQGVDKAVNRTDIVAFGTSINKRVAGTDAIIVLRAEPNENKIISHDTAATAITLKSTTGLTNNDVVIACDLSSAAIFQIDTISVGTKVLDHQQDVTNMNCSGNLGYPTPAVCTTATAKKFQGDPISPDTTPKANGSVAKISATFWYIGNGSNGKNALFRTRIIKKTTGAGTVITTEPEEMFSGIQNLQIAYLTKNTSNPTLSATDWVTADNTVFDSASYGWSDANVNQVVATRLSLTIQSDENVSSTNQPLQRQLVQIVGLRNRSVLF